MDNKEILTLSIINYQLINMKENQDNQPAADISFEVGYGKDKTRFDLRMISVAEENSVQQKFNDLADSDSDKSGKEYRICLDALVEFSENGAEIREKFAEMTLKNERIIRGAFQQFRLALSPDINFLSH